MACTKLRPYFESHPIIVRTNLPIKSVLRRPELSGRMSKWSVQLSTYDITYEPRTAIKSQALADFVADFSPTLEEQLKLEVQNVTHKGDNETWALFTDGAANTRGTGLGLVLKSPQGDIIPHAISCEFKATNNEAEYEALIAGLNFSLDLGVRNIKVRTDSLLIVNQINGTYSAKDLKMIQYLEHVKTIFEKFKTWEIEQVPRDQNTQADALASLGSNFCPDLTTTIPITHFVRPAIEKIEEISTIDQPSTPNIDSWTKPYYDWFLHGTLPQGRLEARAFRMKASRYTLIDNVLFKRSQAGPYMRCVEPGQVEEVLTQIHKGECGNHKGGRSLISKTLRTGFYWPTISADCKAFSLKCQACQVHAPIIQQPSEMLHSISAPWPFMKWGMDIVGKLPVAPGQKVFMLAMTDYFSKWIEADSYRAVTEKEVISFIKRNIICRYGVPSEIVCDNGTQFVGNKTRAFCTKWNINLVTSTPRYPKANGQAESSNKIIINCLKKKLDRKRGRWAEELPLVLWADRTTPKTSTGQTPFSMVYGCDAVIPAEIYLPTARYGLNTVETNEPILCDSLDLIEELRDAAKIRMASYQQTMARSYNKNVRIRVFKEGDLVLRKVFPNKQEKDAGKLAPNWEGPYLIDSIVGQGAYRLQTLEGEMIPRSWNVTHLKLYHL